MIFLVGTFVLENSITKNKNTHYIFGIDTRLIFVNQRSTFFFFYLVFPGLSLRYI